MANARDKEDKGRKKAAPGRGRGRDASDKDGRGKGSDRDGRGRGGQPAAAGTRIASQAQQPAHAGTGSGPVAAPSDAGARIAAEARKYIGFPYVHATRGPDSFDCSGLVCWVVGQATGQTISPDSHAQFNLGTPVDRSELQPGDLLFYDTAGGGEVREGNRASHVGIYVGEGKMINALNPDQDIVESDPFSPYFAPLYLGARRLF